MPLPLCLARQQLPQLSHRSASGALCARFSQRQISAPNLLTCAILESESADVSQRGASLGVLMQHPRERQTVERHGEWEKRPGGRSARIDDVLVERHALRARLQNLLETMPQRRKPPRKLVQALAEEAQSDGEASARTLIELYLDETNLRRANLVRLVLQTLPPDVLTASTGALAGLRTLSAEEVSAIEEMVFHATAHEEARAHTPKTQRPPARVYYPAGELFDTFLRALEEADAHEPESAGLVWLHGFRQLPVESRVGLLSALAQRVDPLFVAILEIEAFNPSIEVRRAVASILPSFPYQETLDLALRLRFDEDVIVRYDAGKAEQALQKAGRLPRATSLPHFDHAYCVALPSAGIVGVLYAARDSKECIKFCSVLVDTWHRGIVDVWGNVNCTDDQFSDVLLAFASRMAETALNASAVEPHFHPITRMEALQLIQEGAQLTLRRGRRLPAEYPLWSRLFRHETESESEVQASMHVRSIVDEFVFDLQCSCCTRPIAANRQRTNLAVSGGQAFCKRCLNRQRRCTGCGKDFRLAALSSRRIASAATHALCTRCIKAL